METTAQQLRRTILEIRRKPYPIKDLIPLLNRAATELERYEANSDEWPTALVEKFWNKCDTKR